ncbi:hypothetical protein [Streptomyces sp. NPDC058084]|uniref:hypothetical protein n=1 Tax=Streptomyces sp. NPDC058084 TaxID=3346333 RepID=UPI0036E86FC5
MRGPAAPTSPGPWDSRSEALLRAPALTADTAGPATPDLDLSAAPAGLDLLAAPAESAAPGPGARRDPAPVDHGPATGIATGIATATGTVTGHEQPEPEPGTDPVPVLVGAAGPEDPAEAIQQSVPAPAPGVRARRGPADPVRALMHRHRELCERAVDPLEIAAGLEAHGVTDRTAARFRHRDVFSLAEELYARVPRGEGGARPAAPARTTDDGVGGWALAVCGPGAVAALGTVGLALSTGVPRLVVGAAGALGLAGALFGAVRRGPLRASGRTGPATALWTLWLLAYAAAGDGLLDQLLSGGPEGGPLVVTGLDGPADGAWRFDTGPLLALALSVVPAAWCAHLFAVRARRRLAASRGLDDFAAGARPLLLGGVALHLAALAGLLVLTGFRPGALALGTLLLLARLLAAHGYSEGAAGVLAAACAGEALVLASVLAARLPGCHLLGAPVRSVVDQWGPGAVPALVCGGAALALLVHAASALSRASAHA